MQMMPQNFSIGDMAVVGTLVVTMLSYHMSRRKENRQAESARAKVLEEQTRMHAENSSKLTQLTEFRKAQELANEKRDVQINSLNLIVNTFREIAKGMNRRVELVENILMRTRGKAS